MDILSRPAEEFENDQSLERIWAMKAFEHAEIYFNLLSSVDVKFLHLTPLDDVIYNTFRKEFPNFNINLIEEDKLKSEHAKVKWRDFCEEFKNIIEDYSFGTLIRLDSTKEYSEDNSIVVARIQFYAIELARNREGANNAIRQTFVIKESKT